MSCGAEKQIACKLMIIVILLTSKVAYIDFHIREENESVAEGFS